MEATSPVQRSNNTTPHHHYYNPTTDQQQKSFTNSLSSNQSQLNYLNGNVSRENVRRTTPRLYTPTSHNGGGKNRSRTHTPSAHSSGDGESHIMTIDNSLPPGLLINDNMLNSSGGSHSITPPNSNSNTTISCGSGNSIGVNIGVPSTPKTTLNHNNNHIKRQTGLENLKNTSNRSRLEGKKSILEEDDYDIEKCVKMGARTRTSWVGPNQEFLPICDALFNVISLAVYFCNIVFDVLTAFTWYKMSQETDEFLSLNPEETEEHHQKSLALWHWSMVSIVCITMSTALCQTLSFKWYKESAKRGQIGPDGMELQGPPTPCSTGVLVMMHLSLCGVLWRYFKLFIPVDLRFVKNEVRDLCLLRLVHAFLENIPMLLIQFYLIWGATGPDAVSLFTIVSTSLSLFSVSWALASFSKNIRKQNVHKLVLTWLGVIFQLLWHLGTIISRVVALSLYATVYQFWIFLVLILHWFCMLMWLISPKTLYHGEKISTYRKVIYSTLLAVVYTFCYVNVQENNSRQKVIIYYLIMSLENTLLLSVWLIAKRYEDEIWYKTQVISSVFLCFAGGMLFMCLYYRYFHLKRLSYVYDTESSIYRSSSSTVNGGSSVNGTIYSSHNGTGGRRGGGGGGGDTNPSFEIELSNNNKDTNNIISSTPKESNGCANGLRMIISNGGPNRHNNKEKKASAERYKKRNGSSHHDKKGVKSGDKNGVGVGGQRGALYNKINGHHIHHPNVPGVFNCRFSHPAIMKRKKKKPSSFVPPPAVHQPASSSPGNNQPALLHSPHNQSINSSNSSFNANNISCNDEDDQHDNKLLRNMSPDFGGGPGSLSSSGLTSNGKLPIILPGGRMLHPFWKRPLSITMCSEKSEGSVGSRGVDIQQKLQEKKQQQLAELEEIEEEIKQGKLKRPQFNGISNPQPVTVRQPIPVEKKQPWFRANNAQESSSVYSSRPPFTISSDPNANEVILDPQYLMYATPDMEGSDSCYYDNPDWRINYYEPEPMYQNGEIHEHSSNGGIQRRMRNAKNQRSSKESIYKSYRIPSDIDSQMSLPRSYTLPREFKYKRKFRKPIKNEQFGPSTNSSDGDVDSGGEDEIYGTLGPFSLPIHSMQQILAYNEQEEQGTHQQSSSSAPQPSKHPLSRRNKLHETKL